MLFSSKRVSVVTLMMLVAMLFCSMVANAQVSMSVVSGDNTVIDVSGHNMSRGAGSVVLFDRDYGRSTRTNEFGVEIIADEVEGKENTFKVRRVTSVWECQKKGDIKDSGLPGFSQCGNAPIPEKGIVISAAGEPRKMLLDKLIVGTEFSVRNNWFETITNTVSVMNPTMKNNRAACGFPGCRGGNQFIVYTSSYGKTTTQTNEFGFEVTVRDGRVVEQEGSDSKIPVATTPQEELSNFVLSGHGRNRNWLVAHAPIGAHIKLKLDPESGEARLITSTVDYQTYRYQIEHRLVQSRSHSEAFQPYRSRIEQQMAAADILNVQGHPQAGVEILSASLEDLNRRLWKEYPSFEADKTLGKMAGVWHRPVERSTAEIGETLDYMKKAGINTVFLETYFHGHTIFPSTTFQQYQITPAQNPKFSYLGLPKDYLATWVDLAHKRGMKLHVWFETFYGGTKAFNPPGPILTKYPDWANVQYVALKERVPTSSILEMGGYFLDPANPEVQKFLLTLIREIVVRYDVDGLQLDYIRYPSSFPDDRWSYHKTTWGYSDVSRQLFKDQHGRDPVDIDHKTQLDDWQTFEQFKTDTISEFVRQAYIVVKSTKPKVQVSTVIFADTVKAVKTKHQDWPRWGRNQWVDFLSPITLTSAIRVVGDDTKRVVQASQGKVPVMSGVFAPFNNNTAEVMLDQIEAARHAGAGAFALFDSAHLSGRMIEALEASHGDQSQAQSDTSTTPASKKYDFKRKHNPNKIIPLIPPRRR